jgi:hypothetical protein
MELLPEEVRTLLPPLYTQEHEQDPMVYVKFFHPLSHWTWYATEGSPQGDDFILFGWVYGDFPELGYFSLKELSEVKEQLGIGVERDLHFTPMRLSEVKKLHAAVPPRTPPTIIVFLIDETEEEQDEQQ